MTATNQDSRCANPPTFPLAPTLARGLALVLAVITASLAGVGCRLSGHPVEPSRLGEARSAPEFEAVAGLPGPVELETVIGADWSVPLSGLVALDHERARAAGLRDGPEPIHIYFHALRHPVHGLFIVDSGVERALGDPDEEAAIRGIVASFMDVDSMHTRNDTATWLARQTEPLAGVFMTHLHLDHVSGLPDVPDETPIYAGPGETGDRSWQHVVVAPNIDRALAGKGPIREWAFVTGTGEAARASATTTDGAAREVPFEAVLDVFGDGSVWALHVPGHTPGSTAYLVRTPAGPVLLVGDASHSAWGWTNGVEPGTFSSDGPRSAASLARLRAFAAAHPEIEVRLGHQPFGADRVAQTR